MARFLKPCLYCKEEYQINLKSDDDALFYFICNRCNTCGPKAILPQRAEELWNEAN